jgi:hypothetical protein
VKALKQAVRNPLFLSPCRRELLNEARNLRGEFSLTLSGKRGAHCPPTSMDGFSRLYELLLARLNAKCFPLKLIGD